MKLPRFKYDQMVKATKGFMEGYSGRVKDYYRRPRAWWQFSTFFYEVEIKSLGKEVTINEDELESAESPVEALLSREGDSK